MHSIWLVIKRSIQIALSPWMAFLVSLIGLAFLHELENQVYTLPFTCSVLAIIAFAFFITTNRLISSLYSAWFVMGALTVLSFTKYQHRGFSLHIYDLSFFGGDSAMMEFLISDFAYLWIPIAFSIGLSVFVLFLLYKAERPSSWGAGPRSLMAIAPFVLLPLTFPAEATKQRYFYYLGGRHASALFVSFMDLSHFFAGNELEQRLKTAAAAAPFPDEVDCRLEKGQPDVFVVIAESQVPTRYFPQLELDERFEPRFVSSDGEFHPLSVETYGGGTWISNIALMTGLSGADFGWRSPYLTVTLENRITGAIPELFQRCGYRTVALYPMDRSFVNEGPFLESIGFETVIDQHEMGADFWIMRDDFYYGYAESFLQDHRENDGRPLFMEIMTMFAHAPYGERMESDISVQGEPLHEATELAEYLRRVWIARDDFHAFLEERRADPGPLGTVVLEFGDHHSFATRELSDKIEGSNSLADLESSAYQTFFSLHAFHHSLQKALPAARMDIAFLGAHFLKSANLASSPIFDDLARLRELCSGRFHSCPQREEIDIHLRRRIEGGLLDLPLEKNASDS